MAGRKSGTPQLSINSNILCYRFAFAADFNLKRRIGAIRRPNMGNVINLDGPRGRRRRAPEARGGVVVLWFCGSVVLSDSIEPGRIERLFGGVCRPRAMAFGIWKAFVAAPMSLRV